MHSQFEPLTTPLIQCTDPCKKAPNDADMKTSEINEVILVGGMTCMPQVVKMVNNLSSADSMLTSLQASRCSVVS